MDPNQRGWQLLNAPTRTREQLAEAMTLFEEACALRPDDGVPLANLCDALVAAERAEEAVARAERECQSEQYTRAAAAHNWLGWFWKAKPDTHEKAIEHLKKAIALRPFWALPHANLGHALEVSGRSEEAYEEHGTALRTTDAFDRAFSHERRAAFEARQGWLRNAVCSFRAALDVERSRGGARVKTYQEALEWLVKALGAQGIAVPPPEFEERDFKWQRDCELEIPAGWHARNEWGEPLADETIEVERLIRAERWDDAVRQLERLQASHYNHFFDAVGYAEKGAKRAREAGAREASRRMLELCLDAYQWYAAGASSGGEGLARMLDVDRVRDMLEKG